MMSRTQIIWEPEIHRRARQRASDRRISPAEYVRRLVARDLGETRAAASPTAVFDLGASGDSDIAANKDAMLAETFGAARRKSRRSSA
jgi:hypothetical protein